MGGASPHVITELLAKWSEGDEGALNELTPLVYEELRRVARRYLRRERSYHTLQSTALVHEAYLRLVQQRHAHWKSRAHFFAIAARLMRRILVDYARRRQAAKREAGGIKLSLEEAVALPNSQSVDLLELNEALNDLAELDPQQSRIVELRFFGGLSFEEVSEVIGVSVTTVKRHWSTAKAWLFHEIGRAE